MDLDKNYTTKIFNTLKDGKFLSQNSPEKNKRDLFRYVEKNIVSLQNIYEYIGIELKLKNGYCYFASVENKEQKLLNIYELIDYLNFFYHYDPMFGVGSRFGISELENKTKDDITLKVKLDRLKLSGDTLTDNVSALLNKMLKRGFIALEDEYLQTYVVLDSFEYLVEFFNKIEIKDDK